MGIRILLADDHHVVRRGLRELLEREPDFVITGEGANGLQILELLEGGVEADVLLTDLSMPLMDGIALSSAISEKYPKIKIAMLTIQEEECYIQQAFQTGVRSYLFKTADPDELVYAVKQVARGKAYLCSSLSDQLINRIAAWSKKDSTVASNVEFSEREMEVLKLIAEGYTNEEAADKLFTSRRTVEGHRQSMIDKTGSRNSLALIRYAVLHGVIS